MLGKVVHLSSVHSPFDTRIFQKMCRTLAFAGYEVVFVVPHDADEIRDGVQIRALSKPRNRRERLTKTVWNLYRAAVHERGDLYHFHDPELMPIGMLLKLRGKRVIYDVHETYRMTMLSKSWLPWPIRWVASLGVAAMETISGIAFDRIVTANPGTASQFPPKTTLTIHNYNNAGLEDSSSGDGENSALAEPKQRGQIAYVGGMWVERGIVTMVDAMAMVPEDLEPQLVLAGEFVPSSLPEELKKRDGWARVKPLGFLSRSDVARMLRESQMGLCLFHPVPNHLVSYPNKFFEYMASGIPIVASDFPLLREIVEGSSCGLLVDPENPAEIAEAITWLLRHPEEGAQMGRNGRRAVSERYNWDSEATRLLSMYSEVLATAGSHR